MLAPASPSKSGGEVARALQCIRDFGLEPVAFPSLDLHRDYLAGTDEQRARDLSDAFRDPAIKGIFALRGGYGTARLLPLVDWGEAANSQKPLFGFSDLTSIHCALQVRGLASWHAPTLSTFVRQDQPDVASRDELANLLRGGERKGFGVQGGYDCELRCIVPGRAAGAVIGGNLTVFAALCGTPWLPEPSGRILFLEDINEKPYRIDRCLTQLMNAGYLQKLSGIVLGQFTGCEPGNEDRDDAMTVLNRCLAPLGIPILAGLPCGHGTPSLPLMLGAEMEMDSGKATFTYLD